jgi:6-phosphogluconolactonase
MPTLVYVANATSLDIRVFAIDRASGELKPVQTVAVPDAPEPSPISLPLALSKDKRFMYAGYRGKPQSLLTFSIEPDGQLRHASSAPLPAPMAYLKADRSGRFLLGASYFDHLLAVHPLRADGSASPALQVMDLEGSAHCVMTDPANRHVLVSVIGCHRIEARRFDAATGQIAEEAAAVFRSRTGAGPRHFVFSRDGKYLYVLNERDGSLDVVDYRVDNDAAPPVMSLNASYSVLPADFRGAPLTADIHLTPDSRFLYASERASNTIAAFQCMAEGKLSLLGSVPTEKPPRALAMDGRGQYLLAAGQESNRLTVYRIGSNGALQAMGSHAMGENPSWIEMIDFP